MDSLLANWSPRLLSLLRIVTAFLFMAHGTMKWFGFPAPFPFPIVMEIVGSALLLLGLFSRPVAFLLSGEMAFAYFMAHAPKNFWPILNEGESAVLFCFVFLYIAAAGGGSWSLDRLRGRQ